MRTSNLLILSVFVCAACGDKEALDPDGDGYEYPDDCDQNDPDVHPGAAEVPYDGADNDCDAGTPDDDLDGDEYVLAQDCDDTNAAVNPGATEIPYDGVDNDCDAVTPDDDLDGDGYSVAQDCDDTNAAVYPGATDVWYDGVDSNCDRVSDYDQDADGADSDAYGGDDCDDTNAAVNPGATEIPNDGVDNDCDAGTPDEDLDGDGYALAQDCDDADAAVYPGAPELCGDGQPNDCDISAAQAWATCAQQRTSGALANADRTLDGNEVPERFGNSIVSLEDINGDGYADIAVSAYQTESGSGLANAGAVYRVSGADWGGVDAVVYSSIAQENLSYLAVGGADLYGSSGLDLLVNGRLSGDIYSIDGSFANGAQVEDEGVTFTSSSPDWGNFATALLVGDVVGSTAPDYVIGSTQYSLYGVNSGSVTILAGPQSADVDFYLNASATLWGGQESDGLGSALALCDFDASEVRSGLAAGATTYDGSRGAVWLIPDGAMGDAVLGVDRLGNDALLEGERGGDEFGATIVAGDFDGSGTDKVAISAPGAEGGGTDRGKVYIVDLATTSADLATVPSFVGESDNDGAGTRLAAWDVDQDGRDELVVVAHSASGGAGRVYVISDPASALPGTSLGAADLILVGEGPGDGAGVGLASVGDLDGDGFSDLVIGAPQWDGGSAGMVGRIYAIYGGGF